VLKALQRLGMKEDEAIEHSWVSKSVERGAEEGGRTQLRHSQAAFGI